jgi:predicted GH43/DUF377 family glycosyl hydrolase
LRILLFVCLFLFLHAETSDSFVLEIKKIIIPSYPEAFNPSIIRFKQRLLMSFRNLKNPKDSYNSSEIGLVWLTEDFEIAAEPQMLEISNYPNRAEDGRLIEVNGRLYMVYSDNEEKIITKRGFRVHILELEENNGFFTIVSKEKLTNYEGESEFLREKNWTPFTYKDELYLSYSLNPHLVFKPLFRNNEAFTVAKSSKEIPFWVWGELRGGTQTLEIDNQYLTFFHTAKKMASSYSENKEMLHYFMGAATFKKEPPFEMTNISPEPINGRGFFSGAIYKQYWGSWRGIFPGGFIFDDTYIYIVYGRQNRELWVVKLDKKGLFNSLVPI